MLGGGLIVIHTPLMRINVSTENYTDVVTCVEEGLAHGMARALALVGDESPDDMGPPSSESVGGEEDIGSRSVCQVFSNIARSNVLQPFVSGGGGQGRGSGWVTTVDGEQLIVTNHHVIDQAKTVHVTFPFSGKKQYSVEIAGDYPEGDLALLRVTEKPRLVSFTLANSDTVKSATRVLAIGYPLGQIHQKVTTGVISGHEMLGSNEVLQTDAAINPGNSGGPLVHEHTREVYGVNSSIMRGQQNVGYAIPSNTVKTFLKNFIQLKGGSQAHGGTVLISKPVLGMFCQKSNDNQTEYLGNPKEGGYFVNYVLPGSLFHNEGAGIQRGDQIFQINGNKVSMYGETTVAWSKNPVAVSRLLDRLTFGDKVTVGVYRNGKTVSVAITFRPCDPRAVKPVYFPYGKIEYEAFAGMVVSDLTQNHVAVLLRANPLLSRFLLPGNLLQSALVVTHVFPGSAVQTQGLVGPGSVITKVNDTPVGSVADFRDFFATNRDAKYYSFETDLNSVCVVSKSQIVTEEAWLTETYKYTPSAILNGFKTQQVRFMDDDEVSSLGSQAFLPQVGSRVGFSERKRGPTVGHGVVTKIYPSGKTVKLQLVNGDLMKHRISHLTPCSVDDLIAEEDMEACGRDCGCGCGGKKGSGDDEKSDEGEERVTVAMQMQLGMAHLSFEEFNDRFSKGSLFD